VIDAILPASACCAEAFADEAAQTPFPEEMAMVANAVDKRRREFVTGRRCARDALRSLGIEPAPILAGERGMPRWPPGVVGSITHCAGYRAAAVARSGDLLAIGIDAEPDGPLPAGVLDVVSLPAERGRLRAQAEARPAVHWDRVLFSAKESVYKAWFPLTRRWLGFDEAEITLGTVDGTVAGSVHGGADGSVDGSVDGIAGGTVEARFLVPGPVIGGQPLAGVSGRWMARDGLVLTAITVTPRATQWRPGQPG
jgi:4'-phosphopantetheinyl transferase EntD